MIVGIIVVIFIKELSAFVSQVWDKHYGERCIGVSWDLFANKDDMLVSSRPASRIAIDVLSCTVETKGSYSHHFL